MMMMIEPTLDSCTENTHTPIYVALVSFPVN